MERAVAHESSEERERVKRGKEKSGEEEGRCLYLSVFEVADKDYWFLLNLFGTDGIAKLQKSSSWKETSKSLLEFIYSCVNCFFFFFGQQVF